VASTGETTTSGRSGWGVSTLTPGSAHSGIGQVEREKGFTRGYHCVTPTGVQENNATPCNPVRGRASKVSFLLLPLEEFVRRDMPSVFVLSFGRRWFLWTPMRFAVFRGLNVASYFP
jgi:hypothetical protein